MENLKGQAIFEFVIAAVILLSVVAVMMAFSSGEVNTFSDSFKTDKMNSKVIQITESILNLHAKYNIIEKWPVFSHSKMLAFNSTCNSAYAQLLTDLELYAIDPLGGRHNDHIMIKARDISTNANIIECGRLPIDIIERPPVYEMRRVGIDSANGHPVELEIWIWQA